MRIAGTCKKALSSSLLIACRAIQLATEEEPLNGFGLQGGVALVSREIVILHCIRRPQHLALLQPCTACQGASSLQTNQLAQ